MTHRQFVAWQEWLEEQWDNPDRTDHYLMSIWAAVVQANSKPGRRIGLEDGKLRFRKKGDVPELTREQATAIAKAKWIGLATQGGKVKVQERKG